MANPNFGTVSRPGTAEAGAGAAPDAGLRAHMVRVYNYMASGLALSAIVAFGLFTTPSWQACSFRSRRFPASVQPPWAGSRDFRAAGFVAPDRHFRSAAQIERAQCAVGSSTAR